MIAPPSAGKSADTNCRDAPALWVSGAVSDVALLIHLILDSIIQDAGIEVRGPVRPRCVMSTRPVLTFEMYRVVTFSHSLRQDVERLHE